MPRGTNVPSRAPGSSHPVPHPSVSSAAQGRLESHDLPRSTHPSDLVRGVVFNIQRYSIHDGPGIRTTIFLKGCPLHCAYCQNPEAQDGAPEVVLDSARCTTPSMCGSACHADAILMRRDEFWIDRRVCRRAVGCDWACVAACPDQAFEVIGKSVTAGEAFREAQQDVIFYRDSGGGITLSGGEPLAQPRFARAILQLCKEAGLHTTLDTSGYAPWKTIRDVLRYVDLVLFDLKHMDPAKHKRLTGVSNQRILENARRIHHELAMPMWVRIPVIPKYNDSLANIQATARFIAEHLDTGVPVHLLPFHRLGEAKYNRLGRKYKMANTEPPGEAHLLKLKRILESSGLTAAIGG